MNETTTMQELTGKIRELTPYLFGAGVLAAYIINAMLVTAFLTPLLSFTGWGYWLTIPGAIIFQWFRGTIVLTGLLHPESDKNAPVLAKAVAAIATGVALIELFHTLKASPLPLSAFWSVFLFSSSIIVAGWILEILFIIRMHRTLSSAEPVNTKSGKKQNRVAENFTYSLNGDEISISEG